MRVLSALLSMLLALCLLAASPLAASGPSIFDNMDEGDTSASGESLPEIKSGRMHILDQPDATIETFVIPPERQYVEGTTPRDGQMKRDAAGRLFEYTQEEGKEGVWEQHVYELPPKDQLKGGEVYVFGAFTPLDESKRYTGGTPRNGQFKVEDGEYYIYDRVFGWNRHSGMSAVRIAG